MVWWKRFTAESDTWEREEDLKNAKELVDNFEGRLGAEVRQQVGVEKKVEKEKYRRMELLGKYMAKLLSKRMWGRRVRMERRWTDK